MNVRRSLAVALAAALSLTACGAGAGNTRNLAVTSRASADTPPRADAPASEPATGGDTQPAAVALSFNGQRVPLMQACNGTDGAVLATTQGEVTITLVREDGLGMRYNGEGMTAETDVVETSKVGGTAVYTATLDSDQVDATEVVLEVADTSGLGSC